MPACCLVHRIEALSDNYIWLFEYSAGKAAVIDPAVGAPVLAAATRLGLQITHILNTHWHPDHVGGNLLIKQETGCVIYGPSGEAHRIPGLDHPVDDGATIMLGANRGEVLFVGAHTAGHVAWYFAGCGVLFPGDTLFAMGCGRLFEGTPGDMFKALGRLKKLPEETQVYCAHEYTLGNARFALSVDGKNPALLRRYAEVQAQRENNQPTVPFLLRDELATNPFVRAESAEQLGELRRAKDAF